MKKNLFVLFLICAHYQTHAQITFQKIFKGTLNEYFSSVQQTSDGGYIMTGATNTLGAGSFDFYIVRTNLMGDTLWTRTIGGLSSDEGASISQTTDSGFIMTGNTYSFGGGVSSNVYLIKSDLNGNILWSKTFGGNISQYSKIVKQTIDGGYIILGNTNSFGMSSFDHYLIKTDSAGDTLWTKILGGTNYDIGISIQQSTDGGYIICGYTAGFGAGDFDMYLIKTDSIGNALWSKAYGGMYEDIGSYAQQTMDGGYLIVGYTKSFGAGANDYYIIKTDSNGNLLWSKTLGGAVGELAFFGQQTTDGGYIVGGHSNSFSGIYSDVLLVKLDSIGNLIWNKTYGGALAEDAYSGQQTSDGGYVICGRTWSFGASSEDAFLLKIDSIGNNDCNTGSPQMVITVPATQVTIAATNSIPTPTLVGTHLSMVGSGSLINNICTNVGTIEMATLNSYVLSPNPSSGNFIISFKKTIANGNISIFNILGENVFTENIINK